MSYIKNVWIDGDIIIASKLNNTGNEIEVAEQSYVGYDIVFLCNGNPFDSVAPTVDDFEIIWGNLEACEQKLADGELVNAIMVCPYVYGDGSAINEAIIYTCAMCDLAYRSYIFSNLITNRSDRRKCTIVYDSSYQLSNVLFEPLPS